MNVSWSLILVLLPHSLCFKINSMTYDRDSGHKSFLEDVFENESRLPGGSWGPSSVPWTDVVSVLLQHEPSVACPGGWTERFPPSPPIWRSCNDMTACFDSLCSFWNILFLKYISAYLGSNWKKKTVYESKFGSPIFPTHKKVLNNPPTASIQILKCYCVTRWPNCNNDVPLFLVYACEVNFTITFQSHTLGRQVMKYCWRRLHAMSVLREHLRLLREFWSTCRALKTLTPLIPSLLFIYEVQVLNCYLQEDFFRSVVMLWQPGMS